MKRNFLFGLILILSSIFLGVVLSFNLSIPCSYEDGLCDYPGEDSPRVESTHFSENDREETETFWQDHGIEDVEGKTMPTAP